MHCAIYIFFAEQTIEPSRCELSSFRNFAGEEKETHAIDVTIANRQEIHHRNDGKSTLILAFLMLNIRLYDITLPQNRPKYDLFRELNRKPYFLIGKNKRMICIAIPLSLVEFEATSNFLQKQLYVYIPYGRQTCQRGCIEC